MESKNIKLFQYIQNQKENFIDLTKNNDQNELIKYLANYIFSKNINNINENYSILMMSNEMDLADVFCMMIELLLYGINILTNGKNLIFDIDNENNKIINIIKKYINSICFNIDIIELNSEFGDDIYISDKKYFCEIKKYNINENTNGWKVLDYFIKYNYYDVDKNNLSDYKLFFIANNGKIFSISFKYNNKINNIII